MKIAFAWLAGWFVLLPACALHAWTAPIYTSSKPLLQQGRFGIDRWRWNWLNAWYANVEDGVSGQQAWIWDPHGGGFLVKYAATWPTWVPDCFIAYAWSAWRNSANNLKRPLRGGK